MLMKKKVFFLAPVNKWGTYFYYQWITDYLKKYHGGALDIYFVHSLWDYIKLHFRSADYIFSIIPFFWKPLGTKTYVYNVHGNYREERKASWLGVKLLYLADWNARFSDRVMLVSYYLSDVLWIWEKYEDKILIVPNYTCFPVQKAVKRDWEGNELRFMTITAFSFFEKWRGVCNLWHVIQKLAEYYPQKSIIFTIIGDTNAAAYKEVYKEFANIVFPSNVYIMWTWWVEKANMCEYLYAHDTFLYWSELDNFPSVLLDAAMFRMKIFTNNWKSFSYFLPGDMMSKNEEEMSEKIIHNEVQNVDDLQKYTLEHTTDILTTFLWV